MQKTHLAIIISLILSSAIAWVASIQQPDMMKAMMTYNPMAISLFTASWTVGMAAMMFPAITPMVLLYNTLVTNKENKSGQSHSFTVQEESKPKSPSIRSLRVILFIGSYLFVWAVTGVALLLGWSVVMNSTIMIAGNPQVLATIYGVVLIMAGAYQFTPLKKMCIGYCESPMSFFMRRWKGGTIGAVKMGVWHGLYCLGCCWAYFLLMVALGWMNLLWMGLFAGIIFGEKMWSKGIWVARATGLGLAITGVLVLAGALPSIVSSASMSSNDNGTTSMELADNAANNSDMGTMTNDLGQSSADLPDEAGTDERQSMDSDGSQEMSDMTME